MSLQLTANQVVRVKNLLTRLQKLEEAAVSSSIAISANRPHQARPEAFFRRAKSLEARVDRLELMEAFGDNFKEIVEVESRLGLLERGVLRMNPEKISSNNVRRVFNALSELGLSNSIEFLKVPNGKHYYEVLSLQERAVLLGAPSSSHLCKTLLFSTSGGRFDDDSSEFQEEDIGDDKTDQFLLVVVPYDEKIDASKLRNSLRYHKLLMQKKTPCVASAGRAARVLGFPHNGVSVVGGASASKIPIIFAESITKLLPPIVYLGGGEPDIKLKIKDINELVKTTNALVLDITEPRGGKGSAKLPQTNESQIQNQSSGSQSNDISKSLATIAEQPYKVKQTSEKQPIASKKRNTKGASDEDDEEGDAKKTNLALDFDDLDVRIGIIKGARRHPASEKLMCEEIDLGESTGPRAIVSGIQQYYSPESLLEKRVCVVTNLKPAKLGGEVSNGMVLAASWEADGKHIVKLVEPPANAAIGARIAVGTTLPLREPSSSTAVKKKRIFETVSENLCLSPVGSEVIFNGKPVGVLGDDGKVQSCIVTGGISGAKVS
jgi:methionine--tRNA ligase beta chain